MKHEKEIETARVTCASVLAIVAATRAGEITIDNATAILADAVTYLEESGLSETEEAALVYGAFGMLCDARG